MEILHSIHLSARHHIEKTTDVYTLIQVVKYLIMEENGMVNATHIMLMGFGHTLLIQMVIGVVNLDILVTMIHQMVINYIIILIIILFTNYNIMDNILNYKLIGIPARGLPLLLPGGSRAGPPPREFLPESNKEKRRKRCRDIPVNAVIVVVAY